MRLPWLRKKKILIEKPLNVVVPEEPVLAVSVEIPEHTQPIVLQDEPILSVVKPIVQSSKSTKLPPVPSKRLPDPKRKVSLNPLSD